MIPLEPMVVDLSISCDCVKYQALFSGHHAGKIIHQTATSAGKESLG
jgi:hypothetical protein